MGSGCLASGQRIGSRIHIKGAYCVGKDDGDLLGAQLREFGSFIPAMLTRELSCISRETPTMEQTVMILR